MPKDNSIVNQSKPKRSMSKSTALALLIVVVIVIILIPTISIGIRQNHADYCHNWKANLDTRSASLSSNIFNMMNETPLRLIKVTLKEE